MVRIIKVYGKTLEELKTMDRKEFLALMDARTRRSLKRTETLERFKPLRQKIKAALEGKRKKLIKTHNRDFIIMPEMVGMTLQVYNGKEFANVIVIEQMIGHRLGEFAYTRRHGSHSGPGVGATKSSRSAKK